MPWASSDGGDLAQGADRVFPGISPTVSGPLVGGHSRTLAQTGSLDTVCVTYNGPVDGQESWPVSGQASSDPYAYAWALMAYTICACAN